MERSLFLAVAVSSKRTPLLAMAVSTQELVQARWVWLKGQFGDSTVALRALPAALEHLAVKIALIVICHLTVEKSDLYNC